MYLVFELEDKNIKSVAKIDERKKEQIELSVKKVNEVRRKGDMYVKLESYYQKFIKVTTDPAINTDEIEKCVGEYLSCYKSFLDLWNKELSDGKWDELKSFYNERKTEIYDNNFEYRLIYNLRNYAQHVGSPVSKVTKIYGKETEVKLSRESFLNSYKKIQGPVRRELEQMTLVELRLDKAIRKVHRLLRNLNNLLLNKIATSDIELLEASIEIMSFFNENTKLGKSLCICKEKEVMQAKENETGNLNLIEIPNKYAEFVLKSNVVRIGLKGKEVGSSRYGFPKYVTG